MNTSMRDALVERIKGALTAAVPGSLVELRGSLRSGTADQFSDIDLLWEVPDEAFVNAADNVARLLEPAQAIASLRVDPDFRRSTKRRLVYVRFRGVPLFWRLDLEIFAHSIRGDESYDRSNAAAQDDAGWSTTESALMNAIATVKALRRGDTRLASELLGRGYERVGLRRPSAATAETVRQLAEKVAVVDSSVARLAQEIRELVPRDEPAADDHRQAT